MLLPDFILSYYAHTRLCFYRDAPNPAVWIIYIMPFQGNHSRALTGSVYECVLFPRSTTHGLAPLAMIHMPYGLREHFSIAMLIPVIEYQISFTRCGNYSYALMNSFGCIFIPNSFASFNKTFGGFGAKLPAFVERRIIGDVFALHALAYQLDPHRRKHFIELLDGFAAPAE